MRCRHNIFTHMILLVRYLYLYLDLFIFPAKRAKGKEGVGFAASSFNVPEVPGLMSGWTSGSVLASVHYNQVMLTKS